MSTATPEMSSPHHPGSQPPSGSGGLSNGGFEMVATGMAMAMGVSPPCSTVGGLSMTDVTLEQALARMQELVRENGELREYLKENNEMMKKQFETLSQWKQKVREANSMNRDKFEQTRALITSLRSENEEMQVKLRNSTSSEDTMANRIRSLEGELNTLKTAKMASDQLAFNIVRQAEQQGVDVGEEESQMRETVYVASVEKEERLLELEEKLDQAKEEIEKMKERHAHLEHDNSQFRSNTEQLLKDLESTQQLKQQIQKENQELQQVAVDLQQQVQTLLAESKNSLQRNQRRGVLGMHRAGQERRNIPIEGNTEEGEMGQTPYHTADDWQDQSGAVTAVVEQLQKRLAAEKQQVDMLKVDNASAQAQIEDLKYQLDMQKSEMESLQSRQEDRIRQLQREHETRIEMISQQQSQSSTQQNPHMIEATHAEDVQTLRSQVLTLINEVHESMNKLQAANRVIESKSARVKELEMYNTQVVEESRSHVRQLQQALSMGDSRLEGERQNHAATKQQMNDLRKSFNQLVSDYKELLETFDQYKLEQEQRQNNAQNLDTISHLTAQVLAAEEAINLREERISKFQQDLREKDETVAVLQAQADVFKSDFTAERDARCRLATEKERLRQELEAELLKNQGLTDQLKRYTQQQLQDMQLRANQGEHYNYQQPHYPYPSATGSSSKNAAGREMNHLQQAGTYRSAGGESSEGGGGNRGGGPGSNKGVSYNDLSVGAREGSGQGAMVYNPEGSVNYGCFGNAGGGGGQPYGGQNYGAGGHQQHPAHYQRPRNAPRNAPLTVQQNQGAGGLTAQPSQHDEEEPYICPSCNQRLPDYDTLNIHVQECLDQNSNE